jgi:DNA-directed RNA polymerase subunit E'/Rpb7
MFVPIRIKTHVQLVPSELDVNIEGTLLVKLQKRFEGVCSRFGFIKPNTLRILQRSCGSFMKPHFNGHTRFEVLLSGEVCNPTPGMVVAAVVKAKNNLGILAESTGGEEKPLLDIIIPRRSAGIASEVDLDTMSIGDEVFVEVLGKRYQLNDTKISIIGRIVKERRLDADGMPMLDDDDANDDGESDTVSDGDFPEDGPDGDGDGSDGDSDGDEGMASKKALASSAAAAEAKKFAALLREGASKDVADDDIDEDLEDEDDEEDDDDKDEEDDWE